MYTDICALLHPSTAHLFRQTYWIGLLKTMVRQYCTVHVSRLTLLVWSCRKSAEEPSLDPSPKRSGSQPSISSLTSHNMQLALQWNASCGTNRSRQTGARNGEQGQSISGASTIVQPTMRSSGAAETTHPNFSTPAHSTIHLPDPRLRVTAYTRLLLKSSRISQSASCLRVECAF